jgi:hypothetical protein
MTVQLPLLPLARTVMRIAIACSILALAAAAIVSNWLTRPESVDI